MHYNKIVHSVLSSPMRMPKYVYLVHMHSVPICLDFSRLFFYCVITTKSACRVRKMSRIMYIIRDIKRKKTASGGL